MPHGARLALNTYDMGGRLNQWRMYSGWWARKRRGVDSKAQLSFRSRSKDTNQREYEDKWQEWQYWTDAKPATKQTKDDQQPFLLLPARWWPATLPEIESEGWWQRPHVQVKCRQSKYILFEDPGFRSSKCHGCKKQMKIQG